jgi:hypothetical protein
MDKRYHRRQARLHLRKLGIDPDEVAKQFPQAAAGKPGKAKKVSDEDFLESLERNLRQWMRQTGQKRGPALQVMAAGFYQALGDDRHVLAVSPEALADRWEIKLRKGGFHKRKFDTLRWGGVVVPLIRALPPEKK